MQNIGLSPGTWQTSLGLGSMSRYSAQILICFTAYIFPFLFLCGFGWELCRTATMHSALCHCNCNQNEAGHQTIKAPSMPCWGAAGPWKKHYISFMPHDWSNWQMKWMKYVSLGSFQYKNEVNGEFFAYLWIILLYFSLESRLIPAVMEFGQFRWFW